MNRYSVIIRLHNGNKIRTSIEAMSKPEAWMKGQEFVDAHSSRMEFVVEVERKVRIKIPDMRIYLDEKERDNRSDFAIYR